MDMPVGISSYVQKEPTSKQQEKLSRHILQGCLTPNWAGQIGKFSPPAHHSLLCQLHCTPPKYRTVSRLKLHRPLQQQHSSKDVALLKFHQAPRLRDQTSTSGVLSHLQKQQIAKQAIDLELQICMKYLNQSSTCPVQCQPLLKDLSATLKPVLMVFFDTLLKLGPGHPSLKARACFSIRGHFGAKHNNDNANNDVLSPLCCRDLPCSILRMRFLLPLHDLAILQAAKPECKAGCRDSELRE